MSERFEKLFALPENLYANGAPVVIAAGALLKDTQTGKVLAQLKIKNINGKAVRATTVKLTPLDTIGKPLGGEIEHRYLDLEVMRDTDFGQKSPVALPNAATRAFSVTVSEVVFADNTAWTASGATWEALFTPVFEDKELAKQYKIKYGENCKCMFHREKGLWRCACGALNYEEEKLCHVCQKEAAILAALNIDELKASRDTRLEAERKKAAENEVKAKKNKKLAMIVVPLAVVAIVAGVLISGNAKKSAAYNDAIALMEAGEYSEAVNAFEELGSYKDSAKYSVYSQAFSLLETDEYGKAYQLFESLGDFKDAPQHLNGFAILPVSIAQGDNTRKLSYDLAGRCIEDISDNKSSASYKYTYDDNGLCIEKSEAYGDKPPVCTTTYYYNASGLCEKEVQVFNDGNSQSWVYTYDSAGRISTETFFGVNGTKVKSSDNTYDAVGNCEKRIFDKQGVLCRTEQFEYDEHGNTTRYSWQNIDASGAVTMENTNTYAYQYDENGNMLSSTKDGCELTEYSYDYIYAPNAEK